MTNSNRQATGMKKKTNKAAKKKTNKAAKNPSCVCGLCDINVDFLNIIDKIKKNKLYIRMFGPTLHDL